MTGRLQYFSTSDRSLTGPGEPRHRKLNVFFSDTDSHCGSVGLTPTLELDEVVLSTSIVLQLTAGIIGHKLNKRN